uniref:Component of oligomeric Golgi complex 8 n=1 Tax=Angiostrongylus cantonensis TaxID=6313 RepID=A0A0K0D395_ANGCA
ILAKPFCFGVIVDPHSVVVNTSSRKGKSTFDRHRRNLRSRLLQISQHRCSSISYDLQLQSSFARHLLYLEEHRAIGDSVQAAEILADQHEQYTKVVLEDITAAKALKNAGEELISANDAGIMGSLLPKCDELERMADALNGALQRRSTVLRMSVGMHTQISHANSWCKKGVGMLSSMLLDVSAASASSSLAKMDEFLDEGSRLQVSNVFIFP